MPDATQAIVVRRFGAFEINLQSGELRKNGMRLRISGQPFQVLTVLVEHAGEVVTRDELRSKLWPADTFVDFDHGLNNAIARIREVVPRQNVIGGKCRESLSSERKLPARTGPAVAFERGRR